MTENGNFTRQEMEFAYRCGLIDRPRRSPKEFVDNYVNLVAEAENKNDLRILSSRSAPPERPFNHWKYVAICLMITTAVIFLLISIFDKSC